MNKLLHTSFLSSLVLSAGVAVAQPPRGAGPAGGPNGRPSPVEHMQHMFEMADTDKDGKLTKEEFMKAAESELAGQRRGPNGGPHRGGPPGGMQGRGPGGPWGGPPAMREPGGPGGPGGPPGPPPHGEQQDPGGDGDHAGPPPRPRPGKILPSHVADEIGLTPEQKTKLATLQDEVDKQMAAILTAQQREDLESHYQDDGRPGRRQARPGRGQGPKRARQGGAEDDRPQRPAR